MKTLTGYPARCGLAIVSGLLYALAFPPLGWGWMVFPGTAGLLFSLQGESGGRARLLGLLHGLATYAAGLTWVMKIFGPVALILWCVLALFTAVFAGIQGGAHVRGITGWRLALFTAINWSALEFIRAEIFPLKFPWMVAGLVMGPNLLLPWVGVYGVGFIALCAVAFAFSRKWIPAGVTA